MSRFHANIGEFTARTSQGGQDATNTVVIGQKVQAKVETSSKVSVDIGSICWSQPLGGDIVHKYITNDSVGQVVKLSDVYNCNTYGIWTEELEFYYTSNNPSWKQGGISAMFNLTDGNGKTYYNRTASALFYIEAPTNVELTVRKDGTTHVRDYLQGYELCLLYKKPDLGPPYIGPQTSGGMVFNATITAPEFNGDGKVAFLQTVDAYREKIEPGVNPDVLSSQSDYVVDTYFPYGNDPNVPSFLALPHEWNISSGDTIGPQGNKPSPIQAEDSPGEPMHETVTEISVDDQFTMYLIYKPDGTDSIWVPLREISWKWTATAEWKPDPNDNYTEKWMVTDTSDCDPNDQAVLSLPVWSENVKNLKWTSEMEEEE